MNIYYKDDLCMLIQGDCIDVMHELIESGLKFDAIITDPPYGTTACKWDTIIPFDEMWECLNNLIKPNSPILLFGSEPFSSLLRCSNLRLYKYDWIWKKRKAGNFQLAKKVPLKVTENISVFGKGHVNYYPIKRELPQSSIDRKKYKNEGIVKNLKHMSSGKYKVENNMGDGFGYPFNIIEIGQDNKSFHPTQKPVELMEYLIKTYTNEGDIILDFTCGSGTTLVAAKNLNRKCYGIELEEKYCEITKNRLENLL